MRNSVISDIRNQVFLENADGKLMNHVVYEIRWKNQFSNVINEKSILHLLSTPSGVYLEVSNMCHEEQQIHCGATNTWDGEEVPRIYWFYYDLHNRLYHDVYNAPNPVVEENRVCAPIVLPYACTATESYQEGEGGTRNQPRH